jgi:hypothetical protein
VRHLIAADLPSPCSIVGQPRRSAMDAERFDQLLRSFAEAASRRHAVRFLASAALGGLLPVRPLPTAADKKRRKGNNNAKN